MPTLRILALLAVTALSASAAEVKYQLVPNFLGTPPGKATIGNSHGEIAVDSAGLIYVSVQEKDAGIQVYGKDGKFLKALPLPMSLHGFVIRKSAEGEFLYGAVLGEQRFLKAKLDGTIVMEIKPDAFPADKGKGKGFQGVMKRHNFKGMCATHGTERKHRTSGGIGSHGTDRGHGAKIKKGKRMSGHMGDERVTVRSLDVVKIDAEKNLLLLLAASNFGRFIQFMRSRAAQAAEKGAVAEGGGGQPLPVKG